VDENGKSYKNQLEDGKKSHKLTPIKLENGERIITSFEITTYDPEQFESLKDYFEQDIKPFIATLDYKEQSLIVTTKKAQYRFDNDKETLIKTENGGEQELGCGKIVVKASYKKVSKTQPERIEISVELTADYQKDYEIIPFHKDEGKNRQAIEDFMAKYIIKPFGYLENVVGVEINFNKVFYKPEKLRPVGDILADINQLDGQLKSLEEELVL